MFDYEQLHIWQRSHQLTVAIHLAMRGRGRYGPAGLVSQLSRSSASIPANIAECAGQHTPAQSARFLDIAIGSLTETQNHLALAAATGLIKSHTAAKFTDELHQLRRMTYSFRKWLLRAPSPNSQL